jgi:hypothetical protein
MPGLHADCCFASGLNPDGRYSATSVSLVLQRAEPYARGLHADCCFGSGLNPDGRYSATSVFWFYKDATDFGL